MKSRTTSFGKEGEKSWHDMRANSSSFSAHIIYKPSVTHLSTTVIILTHLHKKMYYLISNVIKLLRLYFIKSLCLLYVIFFE